MNLKKDSRVNWLASFGRWLIVRFGGAQSKSSESLKFDSKLIEVANWRQGSILPTDMERTLYADGRLPKIDEEGSWVVLTQDCDLIHHDLIAEPAVEVVFGLKVGEPNKGFTWSKNARELHLRDEAIKESLAFRTRYRSSLPRQYFCQFAPSQFLHVDSVKLLARWISRKYFRAAFPNAFNARIGNKKEAKIKKLLEKSPGHFQEIHINMNLDELNDEQAYNIIVLCIAAEEVSEDDKLYEQTKQLSVEFKSLLESCQGINVVHCEVKLRSEVTLDEIDAMQRWDFDSITIRQTDTIDETPKDR